MDIEKAYDIIIHYSTTFFREKKGLSFFVCILISIQNFFFDGRADADGLDGIQTYFVVTQSNI